MTVLAVLLAVTPSLAVPANQGWPAPPEGKLQYVDSTGFWRIVGAWSMEKEQRLYDDARRLPGYAGEYALGHLWPGYAVMLDEGGDWYGFKLGIRPGCRLFLTAKSSVTVVDARGRMIVGHIRLLRPPDAASREVLDARKGLVVSPGDFMGGRLGVSVVVRFPPGEVRWKDVRTIVVESVYVLQAEGGD